MSDFLKGLERGFNHGMFNNMCGLYMANAFGGWGCGMPVFGMPMMSFGMPMTGFGCGFPCIGGFTFGPRISIFF